MSGDVSIRLGAPQDQVLQAVTLYCEALHAKLEPFLGAPERVAKFFASGFRHDRAFVALRGGEVVGIAGFKLDGEGLFDVKMKDFWRAYGWSAPLRAIGLALLEREEEPECLLMDGIAVSEAARGQGIGSVLLQRVEAHARMLGKNSIRLDVIDTNPGARRLYDRFGFTPMRTSGLGPLRLLFSFRTSTEMRKVLEGT